MIIIKHKRSSQEKIHKEYPDAIIIDVTSKGDVFKTLSPFFPHGGIPVPFSGSVTSDSRVSISHFSWVMTLFPSSEVFEQALVFLHDK